MTHLLSIVNQAMLNQPGLKRGAEYSVQVNKDVNYVCITAALCNYPF